MKFSDLQGELDMFRRSLTKEQRDRFMMNDRDQIEHTIMAIVIECMELRERIQALENSGD